MCVGALAPCATRTRHNCGLLADDKKIDLAKLATVVTNALEGPNGMRKTWAELPDADRVELAKLRGVESKNTRRKKEAGFLKTLELDLTWVNMARSSAFCRNKPDVVKELALACELFEDTPKGRLLRRYTFRRQEYYSLKPGADKEMQKRGLAVMQVEADADGVVPQQVVDLVAKDVDAGCIKDFVDALAAAGDGPDIDPTTGLSSHGYNRGP